MASPFKKAGVSINRILSKNAVQSNLFYPLDNEKHDRLMAVLDNLEERYGRRTVLVGQGTKREWRLNRQKLSPLYTTDINDIIKAK